LIIGATVTMLLLSGCTFINNSFEYSRRTKEFTNALIRGDYVTCLSGLAMEAGTTAATLDTLQMNLAYFRQGLIDSFGTEVEYSFMKSEKTFSLSLKGDNSNTNTTVYVQLANKKDFGVLRVEFDDRTHKIQDIHLLDLRRPIPDLTYFWLFGLIAICVPVFNIYVIVKIRRSSLAGKWWKYLSVMLLNIPTISYIAISGISLKLLDIQVLFGIGFSYMGYLNSYWAAGVPLGGIFWLLWLMKKQRAGVPEMKEDATP
jgi:hypothetical protein